MENTRNKEDIDKILELSEDELHKIYAQMSASEIADLLDKLKEVTE
jgi:flagellar motility protein MotE (MotC chaperone)